MAAWKARHPLAREAAAENLDGWLAVVRDVERNQTAALLASAARGHGAFREEMIGALVRQFVVESDEFARHCRSRARLDLLPPRAEIEREVARLRDEITRLEHELEDAELRQAEDELRGRRRRLRERAKSLVGGSGEAA